MNAARALFGLVLGRRFPTTRGTIPVAGTSAPVRVRRDRFGIPHIDARSEADAAFALGFCQGQDRTFQLEALLRLGRGTLAELLGAELVPLDRLSRRIGFWRAAQRQLGALDEDVRSLAEAYARGTHAGATLGLRRRPHEFAVLRAAPTPWSAADVIAFALLQSFVLAANWDVELARFMILSLDGPEALGALEPDYPHWHPVTSPPGAAAGAAQRLRRDAEALAGAVGGGGSNNWAIAGTRTRSGRPLLANDPHLSPALPPHWYLAHVRTPAWSAAGATFVGAPVFVAAHNEVAAWGATAGLVDNTDLFIEEVGPDGRSVRDADGFVPCEVVTERIAVRGGAPVVEEVLVTPRGPIVSPALPSDGVALSMRATWLEARPTVGFFRVPRARSFEEFRRCFAHWPIASANVAYADTSGTIGWQLAGEAPRRRVGDGTLPRRGSEAGSGWDDVVPFEEMPHLANPPSGYLATANNQPVPEGEGPYLGRDWIEGYRAARLLEVLGSRDDWDVTTCQALQMDVTAVPWREMRDTVLSVPGDDAELGAARDLLADWDGRVAADSRAAAVYELFLVEMTRRVAAAKAPRSFAYAIGRGFSAVVPLNTFAVRRTGHLVRLLRERPEGWFARPWDEELADALRAAGRAAGGATWGELRPLRLRHAFGSRRPLDRIFDRGPFPIGGDASTPAQVMVDPLAPTGPPMFMPSLRAVFDVGNWEACRFSLPGGQSGNPLSPHYDDLLPYWRRGEGVPIPWAEEEVARATVDALELVLAGSGPGGRGPGGRGPRARSAARSARSPRDAAR